MDNLFYLRTWMGALLGAGIAGGLPAYGLSLLWQPLIWSFIVLGPAVFVACMVALCVVPAVCPQCRSRLNRGASRCHACTQEVRV